MALAGQLAGVGVFHDVAHLFEQFIDITELSVNAGESDVGDLIEATEFFGEHVADFDGFDFALTEFEQVFFDFIDEFFELFAGDRSFVAGSFESEQHFFTVVGNAVSITFNHGKANLRFDVFVSCKAFATVQALSTSTDRHAAFRRTGVDHLVVVAGTEWTSHRMIVPYASPCFVAGCFPTDATFFIIDCFE